jgi:hypothetical protein
MKIFTVFLAFFVKFSFPQLGLLEDGSCPDFNQCIDQSSEVNSEHFSGIYYYYAILQLYYFDNAKCAFTNITEIWDNEFKFEVHKVDKT